MRGMKRLQRGYLAIGVAIATSLCTVVGLPSEITTTGAARALLQSQEDFPVSIRSAEDNTGTISNPNVLFTCEYGRGIQEKNPLMLFTISGARRIDAVFSREQGLLYVLAFVSNPSEPTTVKLYITPGAATANDGSRNAAASSSVTYRPPPAPGAGSGFASMASWGLAGSLAASFGAAALSPLGTVGVGALNFAGFAQTLTMSGSLPITNLPENFRGASMGLEWVALQPALGPLEPAATKAEKEERAKKLADPEDRFPADPIELIVVQTGNDTNATGQQDEVDTDGAVSGDSTTNAAVVDGTFSVGVIAGLNESMDLIVVHVVNSTVVIIPSEAAGGPAMASGGAVEGPISSPLSSLNSSNAAGEGSYRPDSAVPSFNSGALGSIWNDVLLILPLKPEELVVPPSGAKPNPFNAPVNDKENEKRRPDRSKAASNDSNGVATTSDGTGAGAQGNAGKPSDSNNGDNGVTTSTGTYGGQSSSDEADDNIDTAEQEEEEDKPSTEVSSGEAGTTKPFSVPVNKSISAPPPPSGLVSGVTGEGTQVSLPALNPTSPPSPPPTSLRPPPLSLPPYIASTPAPAPGSAPSTVTNPYNPGTGIVSGQSGESEQVTLPPSNGSDAGPAPAPAPGPAPSTVPNPYNPGTGIVSGQSGESEQVTLPPSNGSDADVTPGPSNSTAMSPAPSPSPTFDKSDEDSSKLPKDGDDAAAGVIGSPAPGPDDDDDVAVGLLPHEGEPKPDEAKPKDVLSPEPDASNDGQDGQQGGDDDAEDDEDISEEDDEPEQGVADEEHKTTGSDDENEAAGNEQEETDPVDVSTNEKKESNNEEDSQSADDPGRRLRRLLVADPLTALASSGFSYVVVTATADGDAIETTSSENGGLTHPQDPATVGASALSRIRTIEQVADGPGADRRRLQTLWDVLFWSVVAVLATLLLHCAVLGVLKWRSISTPKMLHLPRLELLVFMMTLPMIAAAGASLLRASDPGVLLAGICFGLVVPFGFLIGASVFLSVLLLRKSVERRRAVYVLLASSADAERSLEIADEHGAAATAVASRESSLTAAMLDPRERFDSAGAGPSSAASVASCALPDPPRRHEVGDARDIAAATPRPSRFKRSLQRTGAWVYDHVLQPVFGFAQESPPQHGLSASRESQEPPTWLGRGKCDAEFVKRYGCLFEDAHGPQVLRIRSRYELPGSPMAEDSAMTDGSVGSGVLVPTSPHGADGVMQALQTFGVMFAVTKMVLFAVIINGPGGVNSLVQVLALALVALLHLVYLRLCTPYRLRVELAAEMVASLCDLAVFACGIALIAKPHWTPSQRNAMGVAMLSLQAVGFLVFITVRLSLALRTLLLTVGPALKKAFPWSRRRAGAAPTGAVVG